MSPESAISFRMPWLSGLVRLGKRMKNSHNVIATLPIPCKPCTKRHFFIFSIDLHKRHGMNALALAGGCAMNSVANGKIYRHTPFRTVYIQSAAGDAGGAIGAAFAVAAERGETGSHSSWTMPTGVLNSVTVMS